MATLLLIIIYIAFISLGLPDSLFGTAWPAIYTEFGIQVSSAGIVTFAISGCTIISSLFSAKVINRFGTGTVTAVSVAMTAVGLMGFSISPNLIWLCVFALPLGLGAGSVDSALNNYVALHYKAMQMNLLHCFYGIGVSLSPYLMSQSLSTQNNWRKGYHTVFIIQAIIAALTILSLPLWKKVNPDKTVETEKTETVGILYLIKQPAVKAVWIMFIGSCAIEYTAGVWGSTFLVNSKGMAMETAAKCITFYYIGMATGRLLSSIFASRLSSWRLIHIGQGILLTAIVLLFVPGISALSAAALFFIGLGNGPIFPNLIHLTPANFGKNISQSMMGTQMAAAYIGITFMPPLFGIMAQYISINVFPYYLLTLFIAMIFAMYHLLIALKKQGRYTPK